MMVMAPAGTDADVLRRNGRSFHWAGQLLSGDQLARAASLYSLCRRIDDLADEAETDSQRQNASEQLHNLNQALRQGRSPEEPLRPLYEQAQWLLAGDVTAQQALTDLIATVQQDLEPVHIPDHAALCQYCYGVAGTVGVMMASLLGAGPRSQALPHAIDLGIAMQMTNIARDVLEDAGLGRVYLPVSGPAGSLDPDQLRQGHGPSRHRAWLGVRELLEWAERYYASGWQGLGFLPVRPRFAIAVAAQLYREIGRRIEREGEAAYWRQRSVVGPLRKIRVASAAVVQVLLVPSAPASGEHHGSLHQGIVTCLDRGKPHGRAETGGFEGRG
ncbi:MULTISPECIES: phytoene/squalene synthase family protein [Halomonadaceae]|uniref:Squalene/phytoene synthase family protein n=1 Tax=Vreelandella halophila TaxID=86177 RepID=A0A9X4YCD7_9GAMM|nr:MULTISPECIES: phytoene/squalene synthase family protein [Halomonas]MYL25325.1 squalene/phytoene synthase family protein [Halomonas utahensis]MYL75202.1 squalene/phytoene synthase family protein [Halomonas sp. 22501_18_FS]